jgi:hypothetical protein
VISEEKSIELKPEVPAQAEMIRLRRTSGLDLQFKSAESKPTVSSEASAPINNAYAFSMGRGTKNGKNSQESQKQKKSSSKSKDSKAFNSVDNYENIFLMQQEPISLSVAPESFHVVKQPLPFQSSAGSAKLSEPRSIKSVPQRFAKSFTNPHYTSKSAKKV